MESVSDLLCVEANQKIGRRKDSNRKAIVPQIENQKNVAHNEIDISLAEGKLRAQLYQLNAVLKEKLDEEGHWILELELKQSDFDRLLG